MFLCMQESTFWASFVIISSWRKEFVCLMVFCFAINYRMFMKGIISCSCKTRRGRVEEGVGFE